MSKIDYEKEVKAVYPDAFPEYVFNSDFGIQWYIERDRESLNPIGKYFKTKALAWRNAYNNLRE